MCNPPFYESEEEVKRSADGKFFAPNAVSRGPFHPSALFLTRLFSIGMYWRTSGDDY